MIGKIWPKWGDVHWVPGIVMTSLIFTGVWGYLVYTGNISNIWPLFGISNQLLASVTLLIGTTVLLCMNRHRCALLTGIPGIFMTIITFWAGIWLILCQYLPGGHYLLVLLSALVMCMMAVVIYGTIRRWVALMDENTVVHDQFGEEFKEIVPELQVYGKNGDPGQSLLKHQLKRCCRRQISPDGDC